MPAGRPSKYPWDQWTNLDWWFIQQRVDFDVLTDSMVTLLHMTSYRCGLAVVTAAFRYEHDDDAVMFQFYEKNAPLKPNLKALDVWRTENERHRQRRR